ncbi:MAG: carboxypeptidase regulatory-like domain-containing protein [Gemmatimonadales bacterium]
MQHLDEGTLQAWLDGARSGFDPSRLASIERHIEACDACAARADALERSSFRAHALLSVGRDQYAPRVLYEDVVRRARGSRPQGRTRTRIKTVWAASIVAATAVGWMSNEIYRGSVDAVGGQAASSTAAAVSQPESALAAEGSSAGVPTSVDATTPSLAAADPSGQASSSPPSLAGNAAFAAAALADPDGIVVRGFVADEGGRPVASAQVYVAELEAGVLTRQDGRYDLRLPAEPDSFELTVQRIGFRQQTRAINGREGDYVAADFRLREEALALDEIIVTGESDVVPTRSTRSAVPNGRATPFVWRPAPSIAAEGYVGSDLWMLPGLDVLTLDLAYADNPNETHVARIRQDLGGDVTLTLVEGRTDGRRIRWPIQSEGAVLSTWRGEMLITATAPVSADSLRTLLNHLR